MGENSTTDSQNHFPLPVFALPVDEAQPGFEFTKTGTVWTASTHIIAAVVGSGVLSLAWAVAQLGWVAGPAVMLLFSFVTYSTSTLLSACYRTGDPVSGKRNCVYMDAVRSNLGGFKVKICGYVQYLNLFGLAIGYTVAASISMMAVRRSHCFHESLGKDPRKMNANPYMTAFGIAEIFLSQIPDFDQLWWLSIAAAVMSFIYSTIGLGRVGDKSQGNRGSSIEASTEIQKIWRSFQALGDIAFAYSYSNILIQIQDTIKSPPAESKTMKKASLISVATTTLFYMLCGSFSYAVVGDMSPGNLLTGFGFYNPFWLISIANIAAVLHLLGAYRAYCQPFFTSVERTAAHRFPGCSFIVKDIQVTIPGFKTFNLNLFRLVFRTLFVILTTEMSMLLPFFNDAVDLLCSSGFWPLTMCFPLGMYIVQMAMPLKLGAVG